MELDGDSLCHGVTAGRKGTVPAGMLKTLPLKLLVM